MRLLLIIIIFSALIFSMSAQETPDSVIKIISVEEFYIQMKLFDDHILLDARSWMEYKNGRIPHAILAENRNILFRITDTLDLDYPLFLYCASNYRSKAAGELLKEKGFTNIYILDEGYNGWKASGKEIDTSKVRRRK